MTELFTLDPTAKAQLESIMELIDNDCTLVYTISDRNYARYVPLLGNQLDSLCPENTHFMAVCLDQYTSTLCRQEGIDHIVPDVKFFTRQDGFPESTAGVVKNIGRQVGYYKFLVLLELTRLGHAALFTEMDIYIHRDPTPLFDTSYDLEISTHTFYPAVNIGFFHTRPTDRLAAFAERVLDEFLRHDEWDQAVVNSLLGTNIAIRLPGIEFGGASHYGLLWRKLDPFLFSDYVAEKGSCICDEQHVVSKHFLSIPIHERYRLLDHHYAVVGQVPWNC